MIEERKIFFNKPMLVLKIRDTYKAPYHKNRFMDVKKKHLKTQRFFTKYIEGTSCKWSNGTYEIQHQISQVGENGLYATFARFDIREGKVCKIWKISPHKKEQYICWQFLNNSTRTVNRKIKR